MNDSLEDDHWQTLLVGVQYLCSDGGLERTTENLVTCMKLHWKMLGDKARLDAYVAAKQLADMKATKTELETKLAILESEINARER